MEEEWKSFHDLVQIPRLNMAGDLARELSERVKLVGESLVQVRKYVIISVKILRNL